MKKNHIYSLLTFFGLIVWQINVNAQSCTTAPAGISCSPGTAVAVISEDFENGLGIFTQSAADDLDWTVDAGGTPSGGTGPSDDFCPTGGGNYLYVETSFPATNGDVAIIDATLDLTNPYFAQGAVAQLFYNANGACIGTLEVSIDGGAPVALNPGTNEGNNWIAVEFDLSAFAGGLVDVSLIYTIPTPCPGGLTFNSDLAIDGFQVWGCSPCELTCNPPIVVGTDPGTCEAIVSVPNPAASADCVSPTPVAVTSEDFNGCALPAGWSVMWEDDPTGDMGGNTGIGPCVSGAFFNFDCTTTSSYSLNGDNANFGGCIASLADDDAGSQADGTGTITSPAFDLTTQAYQSLELSFDYSFDALSSEFRVEVFDGVVWNTVLTQTSDVNASPTIDILPYAAANTQVRFVHDDLNNSWAWGVGFDNFAIDGTIPGASTVITNNFNGTDNASGVYPEGTTTVTFTTVDANGFAITCTQDITVVDDLDPAITVDGVDCVNGIADYIFDLAPGACDIVVNFDVQATDNCPLIAPTTTAGTPEGAAVAFTGFGQGGLMFDIANTSGEDLFIESFNIALDAGPWQFQVYSTATAQTYAGNETNGAAEADNANWIYHGEHAITSASADSFTNIPFGPVVIPAGESRGFYVTEDDTGFGGIPINFWNAVAPQSYGDANFTLTAGVARNLVGGPFQGAVFGDGSAAGFFRGQIEVEYALSFDPLMQTAGLPSGSSFPIGTTINTFDAEDLAGNDVSCSFNVVVNEFPGQVSTLACNDNVQVSLDESCSAVISADMVLEGGPYGCYEDYVIDILTATNLSLGNTVDGSFIGQTWTVRVTDPDTGNSCWGSLNVEDKLDPFFISCEDENLFACDAEVTPVSTPPAPISASASSTGAPTGSFGGGGFPQVVELSAEVSGVPSSAIITNVAIEMQVTHTWLGDLEVYLVGPNGAEINLLDNSCGAGDDMDVTFDDGGTSLACGVNIPVISGTIRPNDPLSAYNNLGANGTWTVRIEDTFADATLAGGGGTFDGLTVHITAQEQFVLGAVADDNCGIASLDYIDDFNNEDCGGPAGTIVRTWTATDLSGNEATCSQTITLDRPTLDDVSFPGDATFDCASPQAADWYVDTQEGGVPVIAGLAVGTAANGDICDISCEVSEETVLEECAGTLKILRTWTCIDWCNAESRSQSQILKLLDDQGPSISSDTDLDIDVYAASNPASSAHQVCAGHVVVPPATNGGDNCSGVASWITQLWSVDNNCDPVELLDELTTNGGTFWDVALKNMGGNARYQVVYVATDGCGNQSETATCITVIDKVPPVAICDEITEITVINNGATGEGCSTLFAEDLDDGSYDNCGPVWFLMAKMSEGPFSQSDLNRCFYPSREFCCDEVGTTQQVILLVLDQDPSQFMFPLNFSLIGCDGTPSLNGDAIPDFINYNTCMIEVNVDDKLPPINTFCPADETRTCDQYWDNYEALLMLCEQDNGVGTQATFDCQDDVLTPEFGEPTWYDNCSINETVEVEIDIDQCGVGTITRTWEVVDDAGNEAAQDCEQVITIEHVSDWAVVFPDDKFIDCEDYDGEEPDFGMPELFFETCELLAVSHEDEMFTTVPDACIKLVRTWTVINWCTVGNEINNTVIERSECDANMTYVVSPPQEDNCVMNDPIGSNGLIIGANHRTFRENRGTASETVGGPQVEQDGYIEYQQVIKINDTEAPEISCSIDDMCIYDGCTRTVLIPEIQPVTDCVGADNVTIEVESTSLSSVLVGEGGFGPYLNIPPGTYTVTYKATDNCGNWEVCQTEFDVIDCKNPTPYCVDGLNIEIMNTNPPMVDVWADDFDAGSFDNCGVVCVAFSADCDDTQRIYDCDQVGEQLIQLWVFDGVNWDFCETFVNIQDNMNECGGDDPLVQGNIATETNDDVADVEVQVNGTNFNEMYTTDATGMYEVEVPHGSDVTVTPVKDVNPLNGVTTFDLVQISKHILNIDMLDTPYQMIAADANKSESITTFDLVQIRKLILYIDTEFSNNTSWRFVPADYQFSNPSNPFADNFPEVINLNNVTVPELLAQNFVGIKIGDVNGSANANELLGADDRNFNGALTLATKDIKVEAGETYTVEFTANNFNHLGYQFTLNYNGLEFVEVGAGLATVENFGTALVSENAITASWNKAEAVKLSADEAVFTLTFTAKTTAQLSDLLSIDSRYTVAESYASNGDVQDVNLEFNGTVVAAGFELYQNTPNPFADATVIGFNLPTSTTATITISDISGRVLKVIEGDFAKGYNSVEVTREGIPANGVLYYQLDTDTDSATKKMILID